MPPPGFWLEPCKPNQQQGVVVNTLGSFAQMPSDLGCAALLIYTVDSGTVFRCHTTSQMLCM